MSALEADLKAITQFYLEQGHDRITAIKLAGQEIEQYLVSTQLVSTNTNNVNVRVSRGSEQVADRKTNDVRSVGYAYTDKPKS
jgi:hypothetical protein